MDFSSVAILLSHVDLKNRVIKTTIKALIVELEGAESVVQNSLGHVMSESGGDCVNFDIGRQRHHAGFSGLLLLAICSLLHLLSTRRFDSFETALIGCLPITEVFL